MAGSIAPMLCLIVLLFLGACAFNVTDLTAKLDAQRADASAVLAKIERNVLQAHSRQDGQLEKIKSTLQRLKVASSIGHDAAIESFGDDLQRVAASSLSSALDPGSASSRMQSTLDAHGVSPSLIEEIGRLAASSIPRESIVKHVSTHFPDKKAHELNDIVVAAAAVANNRLPDTTDTKHAHQEETAFQATKFGRTQQSFEARKKEALLHHEQGSAS